MTRGKHLLEIQAALEEVGPAIEKIPKPAGPLLALVIDHWRRLFAEAGGELVRGQAAGPFPQPYVIANPVVGDSFVGREDVLRRLEALWAVEGQRPSVVLYGHRRMGKSSILQNLKGEQFGPNTRIVDFNLQKFGLVPSTGVLLHSLAMELHAAFDAPVPPPEEAKLDRDPYGEFSRFLRQLERQRGETRYIVTLDEFEILEHRIRDGKLQEDLIDYLRGVITTQTWLTLAFAGLHTLRQMTEDYWNPLFGSVETIPVTFLSAGATRRLLTAPSPDFAVDYSQEALDRVYELTFGQPYLTQLVGHCLITRLNEEMFEKQVEREARFDLDDVEAVISSDAFFRTGGAYFTGIWAQAGEAPPGTQDVLKALAGGPATASEIEASSGLGAEAVRAALERLAHHDIVVEDGGWWRCRVELMRWWLGRSST